MMASVDKMNLFVRAEKQGIPVAPMSTGFTWSVFLSTSGAT